MSSPKFERNIFAHIAGESCPKEKPKRCDDQRQCYAVEERCNGIANCFDISDEKSCPNKGAGMSLCKRYCFTGHLKYLYFHVTIEN